MNLAKKRHTPHRSGQGIPANRQINYGSSKLRNIGQKRPAHQAMEEDLVGQDMEDILFEEHRDGQWGFTRMFEGTGPTMAPVRPPLGHPGRQTASRLQPDELQNRFAHQIESKGKNTGSKSVHVPHEVGPKRRKPIVIPIPQAESNGHPKNLSINDMSNGELNDDNNVEGSFHQIASKGKNTGSTSVHVPREVGPKRRKHIVIPLPQAESNGHPKNLSVNDMSNGELNAANNVEYDDEGCYNVDANKDGQYNVEENPDNEENVEENLDGAENDEDNRDDEENVEDNADDEENAGENEGDEENDKENEDDEENDEEDEDDEENDEENEDDEDMGEFDHPEDAEESAEDDDVITGNRSIGQGNVVDGVVYRKELTIKNDKIGDWKAIRDLSATQRSKWPGAYETWRSVPRKKKKIIWDEFMKIWEAPPNSEAIYKKAYNKTAASLYKGTLARERRAAKKRCKTKLIRNCIGKGPSWMQRAHWNGLVKKWLKPKWQDQSKKNRINRMTEKDGCLPKHSGGCLTFEEHAARMAVELGRIPTFEEVFQRVHKGRKGSTQEFVDSRAKLAMEQYIDLMRKKYGENWREKILFDQEVWKVSIGGYKKGRMYGVGNPGDYERGPWRSTPDDRLYTRSEVTAMIKADVAAGIAAERELTASEVETKITEGVAAGIAAERQRLISEVTATVQASLGVSMAEAMITANRDTTTGAACTE